MVAVDVTSMSVVLMPMIAANLRNPDFGPSIGVPFAINDLSAKANGRAPIQPPP